MSLFDTLERRFLFSLTRGLALFFIFLLVLAIAVGALLIRGKAGDTPLKVTPQEVVQAVEPPKVAAADPTQPQPPAPQAAENALPGIKLPFVLQRHFSTPENVRILKGWLNELPRELRQEFVDELAAAVTEIETRKLDTTAAINKFHEIKLQKVNEAKAAAAERERLMLIYAAAAFGAVVLIALLSLILVLLAIERNTRASKQHVPSH